MLLGGFPLGFQLFLVGSVVGFPAGPQGKTNFFRLRTAQVGIARGERWVGLGWGRVGTSFLRVPENGPRSCLGLLYLERRGSVFYRYDSVLGGLIVAGLGALVQYSRDHGWELPGSASLGGWLGLGGRNVGGPVGAR